jgi:RNA polymerase sigma-70 factor, ECF subfamily
MSSAASRSSSDRGPVPLPSSGASARTAARRRLCANRTAGLTPAGGVTEVKMTKEIRHMKEAEPRQARRDDAERGDTALVARAVARVKEGDSSALHFLYVRYGEDVRRYVSTIVRDPHEAEDVTQSVFLKLVSVIKRYEPRRGVPFAAWLLRVARNAALDSLRAKRALPSDDIRVTDEGRDQAAFERRESLKAALGQLPHEQREVLVLRYVAGLPPREIADLLQKTHSSIHGLQHRGRCALRAALEEVGEAPLTA